MYLYIERKNGHTKLQVDEESSFPKVCLNQYLGATICDI